MLILKMNIVDLTDDEYKFLFSRMPAEKQKQIDAYRKEDDKKRSVCGYMLGVKGISQLLGISEDEITIAYEESGKPVFNGAFLSIAHAGNYAVCAVSDKEIGIDAEVMRKIKPLVARRICTENELHYVFGSDFDGNIPESAGDDVCRRLLEIWTKKEAYGKMLGIGISYDMKNTDVSYIKTQIDGDLIISVTQKDE